MPDTIVGGGHALDRFQPCRKRAHLALVPKNDAVGVEVGGGGEDHFRPSLLPGEDEPGRFLKRETKGAQHLSHALGRFLEKGKVGFQGCCGGLSVFLVSGDFGEEGQLAGRHCASGGQGFIKSPLEAEDEIVALLGLEESPGGTVVEKVERAVSEDEGEFEIARFQFGFVERADALPR